MKTYTSQEQVQTTVMALPEMAAWPEVASFFTVTTAGQPVRLDWQLPALSCQAVGADDSIALPAVAAIACLQISIIVVDDILDGDPRGIYHRLGAGRAANLSLAFQAAALKLLAAAPVGHEARAAACAVLAQAALGTAFGQDLDVQNLRGEANYWRVVGAKSTPFYGAALQLGAVLGGASLDTGSALYGLGVTLGEMIQIFDDLVDAFQSPANPDWSEGRNNLAILYATTATHPQGERLAQIMPHVAEPEALAEAQQILIGCGAVSYCVYRLLERFQAGRALVGGLALADPAPLLELLTLQIEPIVRWLPTIGVAAPEEVSKLIQ